MKQIPLSKGQYAIVDDEDFDFLNQWKWSCSSHNHATRRPTVDGKRVTVMMHRLINNTPDGMDTDHINGNGLDNRKCNLRSCFHAENMRNRKKPSTNSKSKYKGVHWRKDANMWAAAACINGKQKHLGYFLLEEDAATAYNFAVDKHYGEFARLNEVA